MAKCKCSSGTEYGDSAPLAHNKHCPVYEGLVGGLGPLPEVPQRYSSEWRQSLRNELNLLMNSTIQVLEDLRLAGYSPSELKVAGAHSQVIATLKEGSP